MPFYAAGAFREHFGEDCDCAGELILRHGNDPRRR
jgi:hypothetical protein